MSSEEMMFGQNISKQQNPLIISDNEVLQSSQGT